ncbi:MAG: alpha/beta fold hydrolase [Planctomycetaceae bacterium]
MSQPADNPPLIYVPGLDGTGRLLFRQNALERQYTLFCESYPQDRPQTYEELADAAARTLQENADRPAIVLGESFGGAVALTLALRHPQLVERLVLVNTFARYPARFRIRLASFFGRLLPRRPSHPVTRGIRSPFFFSPDVPKEVRDAWWDRTDDVPMRAFGYRLRLIVELDLRSRLREIHRPALVLAAPNDRVVHPKAGRELARLLPNAHLLELPVGHAAMVHPDVDIAAMLAEPSYWGEGIEN